MIVLGLNHGEINSSAAIVKNGELLFGSPEERYTRQKKTKAFPINSVRYCLEKLNIKINDVDFLAQAWNPGASLIHYNPLLSNSRIKREDYFYTLADNLFKLKEDRLTDDWTLMQFGNALPPIYFIQHHRAHAANSFYLSPFKKAAVLIADWRGEFETTTMYEGNGTQLKLLNDLKLPHSLGMFYATFTQLLGYRPDSDEWKVMALSAFDVNYEKEYRFIRSTINLLKNGFFEMDQSYYKGAILDQPNLYTDKLVDKLGGRVGFAGEQVSDWHKKIACAMQKVSEDISLNMLQVLYEKTKSKNLVLGGGFFMNSVFNGKIKKLTKFENIYVPYAPTDAGNSIGAALYVTHHLKKQKRIFKFNSSYLGESFTNKQIEEVLKRRSIKFEKIKNREKKIASLLASGKIVAVCNGRMEFGERALGNRSILADPRYASTKDKINQIIKYRENYRPFAPVTLQNLVTKYFDVDKGFTANYMEKVVKFKKEFIDSLQAVAHVDGSGRVQTINKKINKDFTKIIEEFEKLTGLPFVLNTSFNINGEPIVLSPDEALNTFFNSGLKFLFINNYLIKK